MQPFKTQFRHTEKTSTHLITMKKILLYFSILLSIFSCSQKEAITPQEANETVFVGSFDDNLYALDAQTGKMKWAFNSKNDMYSPTVEGDKVYIHSGNQYKLFAVNIADGSKIWEFEQYVFIRASPLIENGLIYTSIGGNFSMTSRIYALDADNGGKRWEFKTSGWYDSPISVNSNLLFTTTYPFTALDLSTGKIKWQYAGDGESYSGRLSNGLVFFTSKKGIIVVDANTGIFKKEILLDIQKPSILTVNKDKIYFINQSKTLSCYDIDTETQFWEFKADDNVVLSSNYMIDNEIMYIIGNKKVIAIDLKNGRKKWAFEAGDVIMSSPTVANGIVYFGSNDKKVYALNANDGSKKWEFLTKDRIESTPCVITKSGKVYYAGKNRLNQP
jgi:eukaryotic-like serine/threonine-protein kinase